MSLELGRNPAKRLFPGGPPWHARAALIDELEHIDEKMSYLLQNDQLSGLKVSVKCQYGVNFCQLGAGGDPAKCAVARFFKSCRPTITPQEDVLTVPRF